MKTTILLLAPALFCAGLSAVQIQVANDHVHGFYYPGQEAKLTVTVTDDNGAKLTNGTIRASLDDLCGAEVFPETAFDLAAGNPFKVNGGLEKPGFLRLKLASGDIAGFPTQEEGCGFWATAFHVNPAAIRSVFDSPKDFRDHWRKALADAPALFTAPDLPVADKKQPVRLVIVADGETAPPTKEGEIVLAVAVDAKALRNPAGRTAAILKCVQAAEWLAAREDVDPFKVWLEAEGACGGIGFAVLAVGGKFTRAALFSPEVMMACDDPYLDDRAFAKFVKCPLAVAFGDLDPVTPPSAIYAVVNGSGSYDKTAKICKGAGHRIGGEDRAAVAAWLENPPETARLWPEDRIPGYRDFQTIPEMEWFAPTNNKTKTCIIVAPGGGYTGLAYQHEGLRTARNFLALGMHVVILRYRVPGYGTDPLCESAWQDVQRCVRIIRSQAAERGIDPARIGMTGFSAGGHLTCLAACNSQTAAYEPVDELDKLPCHLDFAAPVYPAYLLNYPPGVFGKRGEEVDCPFSDLLAFDEKTPPMCFIHGDDDGHSAVGSIRAYERLRRMKIRGEIHVFSGVNHGFGGSVRHGWSPSGWEILVSNFAASIGKMQRVDAFRWPDE